MMRLAILAPIKTSYYSRLVTHLAAQEPGFQVTDIVVRTPWTLKRIHSEIVRDGTRLVQKVYQKMVLGKAAYDPEDSDNIRALAGTVGLPGKTLDDVATKHGIRLTVVKDHNDSFSQKILSAAQPDLIIFTGGGLIRPPILDLSRLGVLNCHMGILPPFRGMDVVEWPVIEKRADDPGIGLTLHFMDKGVDTGPILLRQSLKLRPTDTFADIRRRLEPLMVDLVLQGIRGLRDRTITPQIQHLHEGRQYFVLHPRMQQYGNSCLQQYLNNKFIRNR